MIEIEIASFVVIKLLNVLYIYVVSFSNSFPRVFLICYVLSFFFYNNYIYDTRFDPCLNKEPSFYFTTYSLYV